MNDEYENNLKNFLKKKQDIFFLPSPASSMFFGCPHRSSIIRLLSAALRSCSFFNSSAAFFLKSNYTRTTIIYVYIYKSYKTLC